ncbi:hypothetical protein CCHR01_10494 [Colletotrichum chrysophilum]|uniref:Uncharacterized protein n=1 Tax=Colletotrichum chrysophilum TaxID=1836956 RepID=A0AAD9AHN4_9PEZI|nr:hypothetical protein CCHR01_10494 [Colletotrichum chrysophilum]
MGECDPYNTLMDDDIYHGEDDLSRQALFGHLWVLSKAVCETQSARVESAGGAEINPGRYYRPGNLGIGIVRHVARSQTLKGYCVDSPNGDIAANAGAVYQPLKNPPLHLVLIGVSIATKQPDCSGDQVRAKLSAYGVCEERSNQLMGHYDNAIRSFSISALLETVKDAQTTAPWLPTVWEIRHRLSLTKAFGALPSKLPQPSI